MPAGSIALSVFFHLINKTPNYERFPKSLLLEKSNRTFLMFFFSVEGGHRAIIFNRFVGVKDEVYGEGLHFLWPWLEWPIIFDVRTKPQKFSSPTGTKGTSPDMNAKFRSLFFLSFFLSLQSLFSRFQPDPEKISQITFLNIKLHFFLLVETSFPSR